MVFTCFVPGCRSNRLGQEKVSAFSFPTNTELKEKWIKAIGRKDYTPAKSSRVCESHFERSQIRWEASAYDPKTDRIISAPLKYPRLREGAVPTLMPPPGILIRTKVGRNKLTNSWQNIQNQREEVAEGTEKADGSEKLINKRQKTEPKKEATEEGTEKSHEGDVAKLLQGDQGAELQNHIGISFVIKQEPDEFVVEAPQLVIETEEFLSSSNVISPSLSLSSSSSSSSNNIPPISEKSLPIINSCSPNVDQTAATHVSNKPAPKRKTNDKESNASRTKLCRRTKPSLPSKGKSKRTPQPSAGTSSKSTEYSTLPIKKGDNATREMFQSLFDSDKNPFLGSRINTEKPGDLFDVLANFIADKLREMDWDDCAYALRAILDVVFKASKVQHDVEV